MTWIFFFYFIFMEWCCSCFESPTLPQRVAFIHCDCRTWVIGYSTGCCSTLSSHCPAGDSLSGSSSLLINKKIWSLHRWNKALAVCIPQSSCRFILWFIDPRRDEDPKNRLLHTFLLNKANMKSIWFDPTWCHDSLLFVWNRFVWHLFWDNYHS